MVKQGQLQYEGQETDTCKAARHLCSAKKKNLNTEGLGKGKV